MTASFETMYTKSSRIVTRWFVLNKAYVTKLKTLQTFLGNFDSKISVLLEHNHNQHSKILDSHVVVKGEIHQV